MAQKVATARKMKSRQETTSLGQIATVTAKPTISDKHLLEIRFHKNLVKLTESTVRISRKKPKGLKKLEVAKLGFEPAPHLPPAK